MSHYILHTSRVHQTTSLAQHLTYINLLKLALRGHLNIDSQARDRSLTARPQLHSSTSMFLSQTQKHDVITLKSGLDLTNT